MKEISVKAADRAAKRHGVIKAKVAFIVATAQWLGCLGEESTLDHLITQCKELLCDVDKADESLSVPVKEGE